MHGGTIWEGRRKSRAQGSVPRSLLKNARTVSGQNFSHAENTALCQGKTSVMPKIPHCVRAKLQSCRKYRIVSGQNFSHAENTALCQGKTSVMPKIPHCVRARLQSCRKRHKISVAFRP